jgi:hypothetical protein
MPDKGLLPVEEPAPPGRFLPITEPSSSSRCTLAATFEVSCCRKLLGNRERGFGQKVGLAMKAIMIGYWVILVGLVFDVVGTVWDAVDELTGEEALGGLLTPERLKFLGIGIAILGLILGLRMGLRRRG